MSGTPNNPLEEDDEYCYPNWVTLPDVLVIHIFAFLDAKSLCRASLACKSWLGPAFDELLWKDLFHRHWKISRSVPLAPGKQSWLEEYKRLLYHVPAVVTQVVKKHTDEVLHVSFSNNGKIFCTTSKDGFVMIWDTYSPATPKFEADMKTHNFYYTHFSQFNPGDTLLLVSGPDEISDSYTSGGIAVFNLEGDFTMQLRKTLDPFTLFGWWLNDSLFLIGSKQLTGYQKSISEICLCQARGDTSSELGMERTICKFANINNSSVRYIIVANCVFQEENILTEQEKVDDQILLGYEMEDGINPKENCREKQVVRKSDERMALSNEWNGSKSADTSHCNEKILIFTKGLTRTPHQIGIKKFKPLACACISDNNTVPSPSGGDNVGHNIQDDCDEIDYLFNMDGHIVGMCLSPDQRYLYVNNRPWLKKCRFDDPYNLPPLSEEIQIHVIDLPTMRDMGIKHRGHLAYTQERRCFYMVLDVSDDYVVSGAENKQGYLWERHYGICLQKYPHNDVVSALAFNPKDPEMLVSVSDDWSIKIWLSLNRQKEHINTLSTEASYASLSLN